MSSIEELQERVSQAEARFGVINEAREKYSERLLGLIGAIESRLHDQHAEIERQAAELAAQSDTLEASKSAVAENQALRGMLHSLLKAIEAGGRDVLSEAMQTMDARVSALITENVRPLASVGPAGLAAPTAIPSPLPELEAPVAVPEPAPDMEMMDEAPAEVSEPPQAVASEDLEGEALNAAPEIEPEAADTALLDAFAPLDNADPEAAEDASVPEDLLDEPAELATPSEVSSEQETMAAPAEPEELDEAAEEPEAAAGDIWDQAPAEEPESEDGPEDTPGEAPAGAGTTLEQDFDDPGEAGNLEDIMRRVSRLVEEEGLEMAQPGAETDLEQDASEPEADDWPPAAPDRAVSNG